MTFRSFQLILTFLRKTLRRLVGEWSLERKSLLFLGVALVVPIGLAFWFVLQVVADGLVMQTTQQAARDYARAIIAWRHVDRRNSVNQDTVFPTEVSVYEAEALAVLRTHLVDNPDYFTQFLMLDDKVEHVQLENAARPANDREAQLLRELERRFREHLARLEQARTDALDAASAASGSDSLEATSNPAALPNTGPLANNVDERNAQETDPAIKSLERALDRLFSDDGPYIPTGDTPTEREMAGRTPPGGWYVYYHAISFPENCLPCHRKFKESTAQDVPFRAVKVMIPIGQTQVASTTTLAVMIAIAMVTVAATLLVVHWVLRRLVLNPLQHLHSVSDEISRGNTNLRANIDTGDEFNELGDAFNRMLRHMTEGQEKLRSLNQELDLRVDQLAQANLNLYEANRLKSDFLANMSHELRTPLNSIIGFSDVLRDVPNLNDKQKKYAENIQNSGKLLLEMINDILDLAKIEAGKMQVSPSSFELGNLVSGQCDMMRSLVDEKNVDLHTEFAEDLPPVFQDQPKLQQILTNLLSNAIKFTPDGGLITVRVGLVTPSVFQLTVADTGVGIPEEDFEVIFEKFRQSNAVLQNDGLTRQYAGTGLGLSIVKELCKLLGGEIRLSSQLGTGSTFHVLLPVHYEVGVAAEPASQ